MLFPSFHNRDFRFRQAIPRRHPPVKLGGRSAGAGGRSDFRSLRDFGSLIGFSLHNGDLIRRQAIERRDPPVYFGFQGAGIGGGVALLGGEEVVKHHSTSYATHRYRFRINRF